jgi:hypothetical protein
MICDSCSGRIVDIPASSATVIAQNDANKDLPRPENQRGNYATQAYRQCMNHCGNMVIICNTDSDEESVYTPPSQLCETKFHNCEADCAATLKRQWGAATSEQPLESKSGTGKIGSGTTIIGGGQSPEASDALTSSDQALKDANAAADSFDRWYKTGHSGDLPKMKHYVAEAKAAADRARAIAAAYPHDPRLRENAQKAELAALRVGVLAAKVQLTRDIINQM